jgi:hypothetical protein
MSLERKESAEGLFGSIYLESNGPFPRRYFQHQILKMRLRRKRNAQPQMVGECISGRDRNSTLVPL